MTSRQRVMGPRSGWYPLLYHDVRNDGDIPGGPPWLASVAASRFEADLDELSRMGDLVSAQEGLDATREGRADRAVLFSLWFDDGFASVRTVAAPRAAAAGVTGFTSVCEDFARRSQTFWRFELYALRDAIGAEELGARLFPDRAGGPASDVPVHVLASRQFSAPLRARLAELARDVLGDDVRRELLELFDDLEGTRALLSAGWAAVNHTPAHFPVAQPCMESHFMDAFRPAGAPLSFAPNDDLWVIPFGCHPDRVPVLLELSERARPAPTLCLVGNHANDRRLLASRRLYRIPVTAEVTAREAVLACTPA